MKKCYKCNVEKPLSEFNKDKHYEDNLHYRCKECAYAYNKKNYLTNNSKRNNTIFQRSEGYGVYILTHLPTQCYYVGVGWIKGRKFSHFSRLKRNISNSKGLQNQFNKYPNLDDWEFKVIKSWKHKNIKGKEIEDKLIREGFSNNSAKTLNIRLGSSK